MTNDKPSSQEQSMTKAEIKKAIETLKSVSNKMSYVLDNQTWSKIWTDYLNHNIKEEKDHDRFRHDSIRRGISITDAGRLFAVKQIVEFYTKRTQYPGEKVKKPDVKNYLSYRKSIFEAYSITETYRHLLKPIMKEIDIDYILSLDYCLLIKEWIKWNLNNLFIQ